MPADPYTILQTIANAIQTGQMRFTAHAQTQMAIRRITSTEITESITSHSSEIIENYPNDKYSPSCLVYGITKSGRILHVHVNHKAIIITAYDPDPEKWIDLKKRRTTQW